MCQQIDRRTRQCSVAPAQFLVFDQQAGRDRFDMRKKHSLIKNGRFFAPCQIEFVDDIDEEFTLASPNASPLQRKNAPCSRPRLRCQSAVQSSVPSGAVATARKLPLLCRI